MTSRDLTAVFSFLKQESIKAYFCPNIINFDSVDSSESRPEEAQCSFFFTLKTTFIENKAYHDE